MRLLNTLKDFLAKNTNLCPPAARGAIKLAIKEQLDTFKHMNQIN